VLNVDEAPETEHLVDEQSRRDIPMIQHQHSGNPPGRRNTAAKELPKVNDRQQLTAQICESQNPWFGTGHSGQLRGQRHDFTHFFPRHQIGLCSHPKGYTDPFAPLSGTPASRDRPGAALQFLQQRIWSIA
jgi:hypothetical protein